MSRTVRIRFWVEAGLALLTAGLFMLTLISREWIELLFGVDPDGGDGSLEWAIVAVLAVVTVVLAWLARVEWRRGAPRRANLAVVLQGPPEGQARPGRGLLVGGSRRLRHRPAGTALRRERRVTTALEQGAAPRSAASVRRPVSSSAVKAANAASGGPETAQRC
jgi:hypothetical protein